MQEKIIGAKDLFNNRSFIFTGLLGLYSFWNIVRWRDRLFQVIYNQDLFCSQLVFHAVCGNGTLENSLNLETSFTASTDFSVS